MMGAKKTTEAMQAQDINMVSSTMTNHDTRTSQTMYNESRTHNTNQTFMDVDNAYGTSRDPYDLGSASATFDMYTMDTNGFNKTLALNMYEEIALPDIFLDDYYSQVLTIVVHTMEFF